MFAALRKDVPVIFNARIKPATATPEHKISQNYPKHKKYPSNKIGYRSHSEDDGCHLFSATI